MGKENCLLLVHMSDIHCGPRFERDILLQAIDEISDLGPDVIVITGDLTENGLFNEFQEAKRYIQLLKCKHLLI
ncbi:MAG: metallophosphoesterase, partial [Candidatus Bathyarchaeota archaeon]|nr:metallophosphoesterase [Candidatus Bathyarchaeota archaeon]